MTAKPPGGRSPLWDAELIGGPEHAEIVIAEYDPTWPERYEAIREAIGAVLGTKALRVEHVGSTSVPGLASKPIIDVQLSVTDPDDEQAYVPELERIGYRLRVREPGHRMLRTAMSDVHLHVCGAGSDWERRHLVFRDRLRRNDADRALYESTKRVLAQRTWPSTQHYADAKTPVIADIMERASTSVSVAGGASLRLRPPVISDEAEVLTAQRELASDDVVFAFLQPGQSFAEFVQTVQDHRHGRSLGDGWVPSTWLLAIVDGAVVGRSSIRFELNESLIVEGGHIGYAVRPHHRRRGYATEILRQSLIVARAAGIERALLTCDDDNIASAKVIEANGGMLENVVEVDGVPLRRYWIA